MDSASCHERTAAALESIAAALESLVSALVPSATATDDDGGPVAPREAAAELGMNEQTIRKYCRQGVFGTLGENGRWTISRSEIREFRDEQKRVHERGCA